MAKIDIGKVIDTAKIISDALHTEAAKTSNDMKPSDATAVAPAVTKAVDAAVNKEVEAIVKNATNTEDHWYQKRSFWSSIVSIVVVVAAPIAAKYGLDGYMTQPNLDMVVDALTKIGGIASAYLAWRAGVALKPLGS